MPDDSVTRGDLEAFRSELKTDIANTRLEIAQLRTEMSERFGAVQATMNERFGAVQATMNERFGAVQATMNERFEAVQAEFGAARADLADVRKDLAVLQVDIRKDLATFGRQQDQMRQELRDMRQSMDRWQATTARQLWTMVSVVSGAVIVGILKLVLFP
jgi:chromosome segregation ATPase